MEDSRHHHEHEHENLNILIILIFTSICIMSKFISFHNFDDDACNMMILLMLKWSIGAVIVRYDNSDYHKSSC